MADKFAPRSTVNEIALSAEDGTPMVPTNPDVALARLAELEADSEYVSIITDHRHPLHALRLQERKALQVIASGQPHGPKEKTPDEERLAATARSFGANVEVITKPKPQTT